jgi:serine/threonine protein kinase
LWHPHIVEVHDRGELDGRLWIAMDYIEGTDAASLLRRRYPNGMPPDKVVTIIRAVADALDYAHQKQLLHRDVKPSNILMSHREEPDERIFLADFGITRWIDDQSGLTGTNMAVGTVAYAAPEQLGEQVDGRVRLWPRHPMIAIPPAWSSPTRLGGAWERWPVRPARQRPPRWHFPRRVQGIDHGNSEQSTSRRRPI